MSQNSWQIYFDNRAHDYMEEEYAQNWRNEVDFLETELELDPGSHILDVGCGTGRHSVEFARRGYQVTGLDFSSGMLKEAQKAADAIGVKVEWIHADATTFTTDKVYDGAICMLEAAIGLIPVEGDLHAHDLAVMKNIYNVLKPNAKFIVEVPNAVRLLRTLSPEAITNGELDLERMVYSGESTWETPDGEEKGIITSSCNYVPTELKLMLQLGGFAVDALSGRSEARVPLSFDDYTIIAIAHKN